MKLEQSSFNRLVISAVAAGFVAVSLAAGAAVYTVRQNQAFSTRVSHTYEVERAITDFRVSVEQLEAARRGYMLQPGDQRFLQSYRDAAKRAPEQIRTLRELTQDNPRQAVRLDELGKRLALMLIITDQSTGKVAMGGQVAAIRDFQADDSAGLVREMRRLTEEMSADERRLLTIRSGAQEGSVVTLYGILAIALILLSFVGIGSIWLITRYTRDLTEGRNALRRLNEGLEMAIRERTGDLKRANDEIQRFAYIVSHDLRSPLVNVMGFTAELDTSMKTLEAFVDKVEAEQPALADPEAREAVHRDLPEAIGFIRSSTQKMDRLINAILQLSRQGRRVLTPEPLSMEDIIKTSAESLKQRADQAGAEIEIEAPLPDIVSDRIAIEQVFSNLLENAVKYSKPGRPNRITVRGEETPGRVIFEVADTGRGIDPKDHERIFELFRRSGLQDQSGEGIGLAHVRALVYRLGGLISCTSALDQGAVFRVSLPARLLPEQGIAT